MSKTRCYLFCMGMCLCGVCRLRRSSLWQQHAGTSKLGYRLGNKSKAPHVCGCESKQLQCHTPARRNALHGPEVVLCALLRTVSACSTDGEWVGAMSLKAILPAAKHSCQATTHHAPLELTLQGGQLQSPVPRCVFPQRFGLCCAHATLARAPGTVRTETQRPEPLGATA